MFTGPARMQAVLQHFKKSGRGVLVYLRDGAAGVPVEPVAARKSGGSRPQHAMARGRRRRADPARSRRHLDRNLTSSVHDYKGLSGFGIEIVANERLEV